MIILNEIGTRKIYNDNFAEHEKEVLLWDAITLKPKQKLLFRIISTNSKYKQGVRLAIDVGDGYLEVNGIQAKGIQLWEDTCPEEVEIDCNSPKGLLSIYSH